MPDPLLPLIVPPVYQDTDGPLIEVFTISGTSYRLGSNLSPAYPNFAPLIIKGAGPYAAPSAPTAGAALTTGNLVSNGHYKWAVTLVTDWGETLPSTVLDLSAGIGSSKTGQTINLPGWVARLDNPVRMRRLYRTIHTGSQLLLVVEITDTSTTTYVDELSDTELTTAVPVVDTSGAIGNIDVFDGVLHWTEVAYGTTLTSTNYSVDYSVLTGGFIHFAAADSGTPVTVTYHAGTLLGSVWLNQYQAGLQEVFNYFRTEVGSGEPHFSHNLKVDVNFTVLGTSTLTGNTTVGGTLGVTGTTTLAALIANSLHVTGTSLLDGAVTLGSTLNVTAGTTTLSNLVVTGTGTIATLHVTGTSALDGAVTMGAAASIATTLSVGGDVTIGGALGLTGSGDLSVPGITIGAHGIILNTGPSTFNGLTTFNGAITVAAGVTGGLTINTGILDVVSVSAGVSTIPQLTVGVGVSGPTYTFQVTGTSNLQDIRLSSGHTIFTDNIDSDSAALTTVQQELKVNGWLRVVKLLGVGSTPFALTDLSLAATVCAYQGSNHTDFAGVVHFKPGATVTGAQFEIVYTNPHSATPIVILTQTAGAGAVPRNWYCSQNISTGFQVSTDAAPTSGQDYYIGYVVID